MQRKEKHQEEVEDKNASKKGIIEGGTVLVEKVYEPLQAILDACEARLRPNQTNKDRLRTYPDPKIKKHRLNVLQKMIQVTQSLLDRQNMGIYQTTNEP